MPYYKRVFSKPCKYKGVVFRSHLERDFARYLDRQHIEWEYEKHKYELLPQTKYYDKIESKEHKLRSIAILPDFYLPRYNVIVEIKGEPYDDRLFRLKLRLFKEKYPENPIIVLKSRDEFKNIKEIIKKIDGETNMQEWKEFREIEKEGLTKKYKNNYYMADTITRIITIFRNCEGNDVVIFRKPLIESCYIESQKVWENLCKEKEVKTYHNREEFLSDDGFTKEEKEKIVKEISEVLEK